MNELLGYAASLLPSLSVLLLAVNYLQIDVLPGVHAQFVQFTCYNRLSIRQSFLLAMERFKKTANAGALYTAIVLFGMFRGNNLEARGVHQDVRELALRMGVLVKRKPTKATDLTCVRISDVMAGYFIPIIVERRLAIPKRLAASPLPGYLQTSALSGYLITLGHRSPK